MDQAGLHLGHLVLQGLRVRDHIGVGSKAEWDEIGDGGRQHPQAYQGWPHSWPRSTW